MVQGTSTNFNAPGRAAFFFNYCMSDINGYHVDNFTADDILGSATTFSLTGPSPASGAKNVTSANYIVTPNGPYTGSVTITPSGGGLSTPIVLNFSNSSAPQTFTITPTAYGTVTLTPTNSGGLTNPAALTYGSNTSVVSIGAPFCV